MVTLNLSAEQVMDLVKQLPPDEQETLLRYLLDRRWSDIASYGEQRVREAARQRGRDWDTMTEQQREDFVDELVHEDRG